MQETLQQAIAYLRTELIRHLVHLKYLHLYPDIVDCAFFQADQSTGVLISHPTQAIGWDAKLYPDTRRVLLPVASDRTAAECLLAHVMYTLQLNVPFVLKCAEKHTKAVFDTAFHLDFQRAYVSYTTEQVTTVQPDTGIIISTTLDEPLLNLYAQNGYTAGEIGKYFAEGARSFTIYAGEEPVCTCMIYRNFDRVWEIGGLYTLEQTRRKGYARRVVLAALSHLTGRGLIPRYQVEHTNLPSIRLAESMGLHPCLYFEHYLSQTLDQK
jgi:ribosomal protein S18 acetylase RimI-like enzyme